MNKRFYPVLLIICLLVIMFYYFNSNAQTKPSQDDSKDLLNMILENENMYNNYNVETVSGNFDSNGSTGYFFVFTEKTMEEDALDYSVDIWYGSGSKISKAAGELNISPDTYGSIKLGGKTYFRYDLAYATGSQTILIGVSGGKCVEVFRAPGPANFDSGNSFTVVCSAYDLIKHKGEDFTAGHTWKNYYFYADSKGFHEYTAKQITSKDFNKYANAAAIIRNLNKEFLKKDSKVSYRFLKRNNNMIHINIDVETKESVSHSYSTYKIEKGNLLTLVDSGEGSYLNAVSHK